MRWLWRGQPHDDRVAQRAAENLRHRNDHLTTQVASLRQVLADTQADARRLAMEMAQIRGSLNQVTTLSGLVDVSPVVLMVTDLVHDHSELEARLDAILEYLRRIVSTPLPSGQQPLGTHEVINEVDRLARGGVRIPDTIEELTGE